MRDGATTTSWIAHKTHSGSMITFMACAWLIVSLLTGSWRIVLSFSLLNLPILLKIRLPLRHITIEMLSLVNLLRRCLNHGHRHVLLFGLSFCFGGQRHYSQSTNKVFIVGPLNKFLRQCLIYIIVIVNCLNFHDVLLDSLEVFIYKLLVLMQKRSLLDISQDKTRYLFKIKLSITGEGKHLVRILVMYNDENF